MPTDLEQLHEDDLYADLASAIEQRGARSFLVGFNSNYPQHYEEMVAQFNHHQHMKKIPVLFKPRAISMWCFPAWMARCSWA